MALRRVRWAIRLSLMILVLGAGATFPFAAALAQTPPADAATDEPEMPDWLVLDAEYRARTVSITPLELSGTSVTDVFWTEQRARLDLELRRPQLGRIVFQMDLLEGVLFGDNGTFNSDSAPNSGLSISAREPNLRTLDVGLLPDRDPLDPDSYGLVFVPVDPIKINRLYAEVTIPIGLLSIGRQPFAPGALLSAHDGTRINRFGVSQFSDAVDRILFATKLDAVVAAIAGDPERDLSQDRGVFLGLAWDWLTQGVGPATQDNTGQYVGALLWRVPEADWFGIDVRNFEFATSAVYLSNDRFDTNIWSFPTRLHFSANALDVIMQFAPIIGETREISEGFAVLSGAEPIVQDLRAVAAQGIFDYTVGPLTLTMEVDYASGDDDPRTEQAVRVFSYSRDLNVGLLLFEHVLAFETARSAAVGIENLANLAATSFPVTEIQSDGRFNNALALFPQLLVRAVDDAPQNRLDIRLGVLMAWPAAGSVDPILTILADDGERIDDDAVNYFGGDPGSYLGTEVDLQVQWQYRDMLVWTVEGALLFPGSSLEDEHGDAVAPFLIENRFEVLF